MLTADFDYYLPAGLIAQTPAEERAAARLLVLDRKAGSLNHRVFTDLLGHLQPGDALVLNNSKVYPARLRGENASTGGQFELLLLREQGVNDWWVLLRPGKRARIGTAIRIFDGKGKGSQVHAKVTAINEEGHRRISFGGVPNIKDYLDEIGLVPLPPYINRFAGGEMVNDRERYQTVFAEVQGSVAAPTAGLHFSKELLQAVAARGVRICFVTLHVGLGTFAPVKTDDLRKHKLHEECYQLSQETAGQLEETKRQGGRIIAVGTTTVRVLETIAQHHSGRLVSGTGRTDIFIYPPFRFRIVDALVTNFHVPRSTLLMMVSAFVEPGGTTGRDRLLSAYQEAIQQRYRFFSYGDAMFIL